MKSATSSSPRLPQRISLVTLTAQSLRESMQAGHWHGHLPGERELCALHALWSRARTANPEDRARWCRRGFQACRWLPDDELAVYVGEYARTGFQGGLNWYRSRIEGQAAGDMRVFAGRTIDVPAIFIAGKSDWGTYQKPGDVEAMQTRACTRFEGLHLIEGAGHWVQQEQPEAVNALLLEFLRRR